MAITAFAKEFAMGSIAISKPIYLQFFEQISSINFKTDVPKVMIKANRRNQRVFRPHRELVEGWKRIGFIGADGRWRFDVSREEFLQNASRETGLRFEFHGEGGKPRLQTHREFIDEVLDGRYVFTEMHDALFHAPWLTYAFNRRMFNLAARFDVVLNNQVGRESPLNNIFEFLATDGSETYLMGPFQIADVVLDGGFRYEHPDPKTQWKWIQSWENKNNPPFFVLPSYRAYSNTRMTWLFALSMMENHLLQLSEVKEIDQQAAQQLLRDIRLELEPLKGDRSLMQQVLPWGSR